MFAFHLKFYNRSQVLHNQTLFLFTQCHKKKFKCLLAQMYFIKRIDCYLIFFPIYYIPSRFDILILLYLFTIIFCFSSVHSFKHLTWTTQKVTIIHLYHSFVICINFNMLLFFSAAPSVKTTKVSNHSYINQMKSLPY